MERSEKSEIYYLNCKHCFELKRYESPSSTQALFVVPGLGSTDQLVKWVLDFLPEYFDLVVPLPFGVSNTGVVKDGQTIEDLADCLCEVVNELELKNYKAHHLWGISFGGFVAQLMIKKDFSLWKSLTLFCTSSAAKEFPNLAPLDDRIFHHTFKMDALSRAQASTQVSVDPENLKNKELVDWIVQQRVEKDMPLETVLWQNQEAKNFLASDFTLKYTKELPTLIMSGENDRLVPVKNISAFKKYLPWAQTEVVAQADHLFFLEHSKYVGKKLANFLMATLSLGVSIETSN